ncbi:MAG: hypothetical protein R3C14_26225 [Caldilineaceae bacterium]
MSTKLIAKEITLHDLEKQFHLQRSDDSQFFPEWQINSPVPPADEQKLLDLAKAGYLNLIKYPAMLENAVQLTVLSPLLHLANLLLDPFHLQTETSIVLSTSDGEMTIEGRIDVLILKENFWVLVIESKRAEFSVKVGLAQILAYMLANPTPSVPSYGLITNGGSYLFVKLVMDEPPTYALSRVFDLLNPGNDLYQVLAILKEIRQVALAGFAAQTLAEPVAQPTR